MKGMRLRRSIHPGVSYTFRSLSVNKRETVTQMVDPLNFRFMDARLKNVASLRRRRDAPFFFLPLPPSPGAFFPRLQCFFLPFHPSFSIWGAVSPIDASDSIPYWLYIEKLCRKYNKPPPFGVTMHTISLANTVKFAAFRDNIRSLMCM